MLRCLCLCSVSHHFYLLSFWVLANPGMLRCLCLCSVSHHIYLLSLGFGQSRYVEVSVSVLSQPSYLPLVTWFWPIQVCCVCVCAQSTIILTTSCRLFLANPGMLCLCGFGQSRYVVSVWFWPIQVCCVCVVLANPSMLCLCGFGHSRYVVSVSVWSWPIQVCCVCVCVRSAIILIASCHLRHYYLCYL